MGNSFNFKLQKVLDIRKEKEDESIKKFKDVQVQKNKIEQNLEKLNVNYKKYNSKGKDEGVIYQKIKRNYLNALVKEIEITETELRNKDKELEEKRIDLNEKRVKRKTVETLKEKKLKKFIEEENKIERINLDELALYAFIRNGRKS